MQEGQTIKHEVYGLGIVTASDQERTAVDFDRPHRQRPSGGAKPRPQPKPPRKLLQPLQQAGRKLQVPQIPDPCARPVQGCVCLLSSLGNQGL